MSKIQFQYDIQNLTPANAAPVEANFTKVEQHINQEVVERDGTVAMRAQLKLVGDPVANLDAAPKQYVDQVIPVGLIMMWGAAIAPANGKWLICDGSPLQTASYPELFAVIGYAWGGSGGTFNAPNLSGRVAVGVSATHAMATTGGSEDASLPAHTHPMPHSHGDTAAADTNHQHAGVDHLHGAGGLVAANAGLHYHISTGDPALNMLVAEAGGPQLGGGAPFTNMPTIGYRQFSSQDGIHQHTLTGTTGAADRALTTGFMDRAATHAHTTPAFNGATAQTGVAPAGTNMPPFIAIQHIIRCK